MRTPIPDWSGSGGAGARSLIGTIPEWCGLVSVGSPIRARTILDWSGQQSVAAPAPAGTSLEWTGLGARVAAPATVRLAGHAVRPSSSVTLDAAA